MGDIRFASLAYTEQSWLIVMKILHVIPYIGTLRGDPSKAVRQIARVLVKSGHRVDIATTNDWGKARVNMPLGKPIDEDGYTIRYFNCQTPFDTVSLPLTRWLAQQIKNY